MTKQEERDQAINDFYLMALYDLEQGYTIDDLQETLRLYEEVEEFEGCAGDSDDYLDYMNLNKIIIK